MEVKIPAFNFNFWNETNHDSVVDTTCLMPNSITIPLTVSTRTSFHELKNELWKVAITYPLYEMLHGSSSYSISYVNAMAQREIIMDENKLLCEVRPFSAVLNIVERQEDKAENVLNAQISSLIEKNLLEFDSSKISEVNQFGEKIKPLADQIQGNRQRPLIDSACVRESLSQDLNDILLVVSKLNVTVPEEVNIDQTENFGHNKTCATLTLHENPKHTSVDIDDQFKFKVNYISKLSCDVTRTVEVGIEAALFHEGKVLCKCVRTSEKVVNKNECTWNEELAFDMSIADIPRMACLCLVVYEVSKIWKGLRVSSTKESKQEIIVTPMNWVNTTVYDLNNQLKSGSTMLYMWSYTDLHIEKLSHPLDTFASNLNIEQATALIITYHSYQRAEQVIVYPSLEKLREYADKKVKEEFKDQAAVDLQSLKTYLDQIQTMAERREPLDVMHEQDRKKLWCHRYHLLQSMPGLLSKLLDCVEWSIQWEVAEVTSLVFIWPLLIPPQALELLDYAYADQKV